MYKQISLHHPTPLSVDWSYRSAAVTEAECWILKENRALLAVLIVFFVVVVVAAVVVLFVLPPVVVAPIGDCGRKSWNFTIRKATQCCHQLRSVQDFPAE